jgi:hypothetical protein
MVTSNLHAQSDYKPGFIINNNNDTVHGFIFYRAENLHEKCTFKKTKDAKSVDYKPFDIVAFGFAEGTFYISKNFTIENETSAAFLEYLIRGKASIYYLRRNTDHYFIEKENTRIIELTEPDKYVKKDGKTFFINKQFKGKLKATLQDCREIFPQIEQTNLTHSSLTKLAKTYHNKVCPDQQCEIFERTRKSIHVNWNIYGGTSFDKLEFGIDYKTNYASGIKFGAGIEIENILQWTERISLGLDITLHKLNQVNLISTPPKDNFNILFTEYEGTKYQLTPNTAFNVNLKTSFLDIPFSVNYTFSRSKIRPFVNVAFFNRFTLTQNKTLKLNRFYKEFNQSIPNYYLGYLVRVGLRYMLNKHSINLSLTYDKSQNMNIKSLQLRTKAYSILAGFTF